VAKRTASNSTVHYFFSDHLGSSSVVTNSTGTTLEEDMDYYPYGGTALGTSSDHYLFTGKERDGESGLDNFGARYYASSLARFLSPDWNDAPEAVPYASIGSPQTLNLYAYVKNSPVVFLDPTGHGNTVNLGGQVTMRVDTMSADQVNIHIKDGNTKAVRGKLDPDTGNITWTDGQPSNKVAKAAQEWLVRNGKYDIAKAKKEMSILGGNKTKEGSADEGISGAASKAIIIAMLADVVADQITRTRINSMEATTGFHVGIDGQLAVTNLQKFGDTFGVGTMVKFEGDTFTLGADGLWTDANGNQLTQDSGGIFHIHGQSS
jgi:RHS repeat-associated protein